MAVQVGFRCDVISCERARRCVWFGAAVAESSACGRRSNEVELTYILDRGQFFCFLNFLKQSASMYVRKLLLTENTDFMPNQLGKMHPKGMKSIYAKFANIPIPLNGSALYLLIGK